MTDEKRTPAEKAAQTRREHAEAHRAEIRARIRDKDEALRICREIRDDINAADADRLHAIEMIEAIADR